MNVYLYVKRNYIYKEKLRSYRDLNFFFPHKISKHVVMLYTNTHIGAVMLLVLKYIYIYIHS